MPSLKPALVVSLVVVALAWAAPQLAIAQTATVDPSAAANSGGPIRLRQPGVPAPLPAASAAADSMRMQQSSMQQLPPEKPRPGEFENFVQRMAGEAVPIRRFGAELMTPLPGDSTDVAPLVPPDYLIKPGDELLPTL
jgi:hypothetical protein